MNPPVQGIQAAIVMLKGLTSSAGVSGENNFGKKSAKAGLCVLLPTDF